jgi:hypothetical protein
MISVSAKVFQDCLSRYGGIGGVVVIQPVCTQPMNVQRIREYRNKTRFIDGRSSRKCPVEVEDHKLNARISG